MKRADIQPWQVYGENSNRDRHYRFNAVMPLSTDLYMIDRYTHVLARASEHHTAMTSGRASYSNAVGILCVSVTETDHDAVRELRALASVEAAVAGINGAGREIVNADGRKLGTYYLLTNQRHLHGDYYELTAELAAREARNRELARQAEARADAQQAAYTALSDRLGELGLKPWRNRHNGLIELTHADMAKLLTLAELGKELTGGDVIPVAPKPGADF